MLGMETLEKPNQKGLVVDMYFEWAYIKERDSWLLSCCAAESLDLIVVSECT